jgi:hypothetical protein
MHDPGAEADVPGGRGKYAELHLGRRVMRVLRHQMVLAEERVVESRLSANLICSSISVNALRS